MTSSATWFQHHKQLYVAEESKLESIVADGSFLQTFQAWLDTTIAQLDFQYERCEQQLSELQQTVAVQGGSYWCSKTIIEHCSLHMSEKRLVQRGASGQLEGADAETDRAQLPDAIRLITCLQQTKEHSYMTPKQRHFIEEFQARLKTVVFEPRDLLFLTNALSTKLRDDGNTRGVFGDLAAFQNSVEDLSPDIEQCEQLLEASIANGEMALAEDISQRQLEIYQHILTLITDQYPIIANYYSESRNSDRRRRWAIFRMADKDISAVIESKFKQIDACEDDLQKLQQQTRNYGNDDVEQKRRYEADRSESELFLQQNKEKQQGVWNRVFALFKELQTCQEELSTLARQRRTEVERRLQVEEREAGRRSGHEAFLAAAAAHAEKLRATIENASAAGQSAQALNDFVLDGCGSIAAKYDKQQAALAEMLRLVQQHHFKRYSDFYIAASRYLYRKEHKLEQIKEKMNANDMQRELQADSLDPSAKRYAEANAQLALKRREVAQEVLHLRHRMEKADKAIEPTLRSLDSAGIAYVHPRVIAEQMNLNRWSTILTFKELLNPSTTQMERLYEEEKTTLAALRASLESAGVVSEDADGTWHSHTRRGIARSEAAAAAARASTAKVPRTLQEKVQRMRDKQLAYTHGGPGEAGQVEAATGAASQPPKHPLAATYPEAGATSGASAPPPAAAAPAHMEGTTFTALYAYKARAPDELSFDAGDCIVCLSRAPEEGWFRGVCEQRAGLFPINYVTPTQP